MSSRKTAYQALGRFVAQRAYILRMERSKEFDLRTEGKFNVLLQRMRREDRSVFFRRAKRYYWM